MMMFDRYHFLSTFDSEASQGTLSMFLLGKRKWNRWSDTKSYVEPRKEFRRALVVEEVRP